MVCLASDSRIIFYGQSHTTPPTPTSIPPSSLHILCHLSSMIPPVTKLHGAFFLLDVFLLLLVCTQSESNRFVVSYFQNNKTSSSTQRSCLTPAVDPAMRTRKEPASDERRRRKTKDPWNGPQASSLYRTKLRPVTIHTHTRTQASNYLLSSTYETRMKTYVHSHF
jgi:hypothetical protein